VWCCACLALAATGLVFMLTWVLYSSSAVAPWLAALAPGAVTVQVLLVGFGVMKDEKLVQGMTRTGKASELLGGPLLYGAIHALFTVVWWRSSAAGMVGLAALCAGDGLAGLYGTWYWRELGRLPHNPDKTWAGTLACLLGSFFASSSLLLLFSTLGFTHAAGGGALTFGRILRGCAYCSMAAAAVESMPLGNWDNLWVPLSAALIAMVEL